MKLRSPFLRHSGYRGLRGRGRLRGQETRVAAIVRPLRATHRGYARCIGPDSDKGRCAYRSRYRPQLQSHHTPGSWTRNRPPSAASRKGYPIAPGIIGRQCVKAKITPEPIILQPLDKNMRAALFIARLKPQDGIDRGQTVHLVQPLLKIAQLERLAAHTRKGGCQLALCARYLDLPSSSSRNTSSTKPRPPSGSVGPRRGSAPEYMFLR